MAYWCTVDQVRERIRQATEAAGWADAQVQARITRAMDMDLKPAFTPRYGATEVALWDTEATRPDVIDHLTAVMAAAHVLGDCYGQDPYLEGTMANNLYGQFRRKVDEIFSGQADLVLADGTIIRPIDTGRTQWGSNRYDSAEGTQEPLYTMHEEALDNTQPGSLDAY